MRTYHISHYVNGLPCGERTFIGYTKREAIKRYREEFDLKYKRVKLVVQDENRRLA